MRRPTYLEYLSLVVDARRAHPEWRRGQAHFNVLVKVAPELAEEIRASDLDPFYADHYPLDRTAERFEGYLGFVARRLG